MEVLENIKARNITEIYSLGDNIGYGSNPKEVIDLLEKYNVNSISGNSEYYLTLGTSPFNYLDKNRLLNEEWTYDELGSARIDLIKNYPASIDINVGDKKVALCHFINDVRWDFINHSVFEYLNKVKNNEIPIQFDYTNSDEALLEVLVNSYKNGDIYSGYRSARDNKIFEGKKVNYYDSVFQGHAHFASDYKFNNTDIYTLRALGMGENEKSKKNMACYYIIKEKISGGFDIEKVFVPFNINYLRANIESSKLPYKSKILKFLS